MAPQKKMTLQEFFNDQSFGGSWADDEIDMASISVPIEKYKHSQYSKDPFGSSHSSGFGGHSSYNRQSGLHDNGPPYIVKLLNLPITCDDAFIEDLFKSRYTSFVKFKIVADPSSNILETHVIKKVSFVELESFQEMSKVLKWQDLYYKATRRVVIELADFHDFQHCISFNQEHQVEIQQIEDDFIHKKHNQHFGQGGFENSTSRGIHVNSPPRRHEPLNSHHNLLHQPSLSDKKLSALSEGPAATPSVAAPPKNKPNPFGLAKPVDVVAKLHEIDKKLITINHTTIRTLGSAADEDQEKHVSSDVYHVPRERRPSQKDSRRSSINILKRPQQTESEEPEKAQLTTAPIPESIYAPKDSNKSLAELLSKNGDSSPPKGRSTPKSMKGSPKPSAPKPVILKKKNLVTSASLTAKDSEGHLRPDVIKGKDTSVEGKEKDEDVLNDANIPTLKTAEQPSNVSESYSNGSSASTEKSPVMSSSPKENKQIHKVQPTPIREPERANDRPNFKKHFADLNKRQLENKDRGQSFRGNFNNNKKNNNLNRRHSKSTLKDISANGDASKHFSGNSKRPDESKNKLPSPKTNDAATGEVNVEGPLSLESNAPGKGKNRHSSKNKSPVPVDDKANEESRPRTTPHNLKGHPVRNGKKIKGPRKSNILRNQNDGETKDIKNQKGMNNNDKSNEETKNTNNAEKTADLKGINDRLESSRKPSKHPIDKGEISKESSLNDFTSTNEPASYSTGGKTDDSDVVRLDISPEANSETAKEHTNTGSINSSRGRRGRGRERGAFRGSTRGFRGGRGRGNFNLHYVRNKDNGDTES